MTNTKFVAVQEEVQAAVIWVDDMEIEIKALGMDESLERLMDRVFAGDLKVEGPIHVIDDNKELAEQMATLLNNKYAEEMVIMKDAKIVKEQVNKVVDSVMPKQEEATEDNAAVIAKSAAAKKFLKKHGAELANAKKAPAKKEETKTETTKEEKKMETKTTMGGRRKLVGGKPSYTQAQVDAAKAAKETKTEKEVVNVKKEETKVAGGRRRMSSGSTPVKEKSAGGRKRLGRSENLNKGEFVKFEGPWYLNKSRYEVLNRFEDIIENMADAELGITEIAMVEKSEISRYANREDIMFVVQIKANGNVLDFPIREAGSNSKSDLSSPSIGWVEYKGKLYPKFGFSRPNAIEVNMTCGCGTKFKANTGNVYCHTCKTRHDDVAVEMEHGTLDFAGDVEGWVFQEIPNLKVPTDTLVLAMALAQYDEGLDMWDVVSEEDAE
jgi:hypothetical protein